MAIKEVHVLIFKIIGIMKGYSFNKIRATYDKFDELPPKVGVEILTINVDDDEDNNFIGLFKQVQHSKLK